MLRIGIFCLIIGVGSFILPMMGRQFILVSIFGEAAPLVGAGLAVLGLGLVIAGIVTRRGS